MGPRARAPKSGGSQQGARAWTQGSGPSVATAALLLSLFATCSWTKSAGFRFAASQVELKCRNLPHLVGRQPPLPRDYGDNEEKDGEWVQECPEYWERTRPYHHRPPPYEAGNPNGLWMPREREPDFKETSRPRGSVDRPRADPRESDRQPVRSVRGRGPPRYYDDFDPYASSSAGHAAHAAQTASA